jgi:hypothetical protein
MVQHLNETSGTHYDSTSNNNDGTPYGSLNQDATGQIDGADNFDGTNDYIGCVTSNMPTTSGTISAWVKPSGGWVSNTLGIDAYVVEIGLDNEDRAFLYFNDDGTTRMLVARGGTVKWALSDKTSWSEQWYHLVGTWNSTSIRLYIDGSEDSTPQTGWSISTPTSVTIGRASTLSPPINYFNGIIDEVRISNTARSAGWIATRYNNQHSPGTFYSVGGEETVIYPEEPVLSSESPRDGATGVGLNPTLSITAADLQGDLMNITFRTNATGTWQDLGSHINVGDGTYNQTTTNMDSCNTTYWWRVCATDGASWTNKTYSFTTELGPGAWWSIHWQYRKMIIINHAMVVADIANFPVLMDITDGDLASKAQDDGDDIVFTDYYGTKLDHQIELFNGANGHLIAWGKVPYLSSTVDTIIYMYYGNAAASNQQNPSGVWDSHYVMVQHLNETSGTHYDSTSNNNDGTPYGGLNQDATGQIDGADDFDGTDDYIKVNNAPSLNVQNKFTIELWAKRSSISNAYERLVMKYLTDGSQRAYGFFIYDDNKLGLVVSNNGVAVGTIKSNLGVTDTNWHYLAVVFDSGSITFYKDYSTDMQSSTITSIYASSTDLYLGCSQFAGLSQFFKGIMDEICISNTARSTEWIATQFNNQLSPNTFYAIGSEETSGAEHADLVVDSIVIDSQGCAIYCNDTYANGSSYYVPVKITVRNTGILAAGQFNVSFEVYWITGGLQESLVEQTVLNLNAGQNLTLTFWWKPSHTRYYRLTATADCDGEVNESNEGNNVRSLLDVPVTVIGDINGDGVINILDAVVISKAWDATPSDPWWNVKADINHDGIVNILDGTRIGLHWGKNW